LVEGLKDSIKSERTSFFRYFVANNFPIIVGKLL
jgi:hypothetical protein